MVIIESKQRHHHLRALGPKRSRFAQVIALTTCLLSTWTFLKHGKRLLSLLISLPLLCRDWPLQRPPSHHLLYPRAWFPLKTTAPSISYRYRRMRPTPTSPLECQAEGSAVWPRSRKPEQDNSSHETTILVLVDFRHFFIGRSPTATPKAPHTKEKWPYWGRRCWL